MPSPVFPAVDDHQFANFKRNQALQMAVNSASRKTRQVAIWKRSYVQRRFFSSFVVNRRTGKSIVNRRDDQHRQTYRTLVLPGFRQFLGRATLRNANLDQVGQNFRQIFVRTGRWAATHAANPAPPMIAFSQPKAAVNAVSKDTG